MRAGCAVGGRPCFAPRSGAGTPEACQEISRGLSERQRAQPRLSENQEQPHPGKGASSPRHPFRVRILELWTYPGVRKKRVPLANLLAPLRGAVREVIVKKVFLLLLLSTERASGSRQGSAGGLPQSRP